jgi:hypothetical protein
VAHSLFRRECDRVESLFFEEPRTVSEPKSIKSAEWSNGTQLGRRQRTLTNDIFPKIEVFTHEGHLFTNCGCAYSSYFAKEANFYPLVPPDDYHGLDSVPYLYEECDAAYTGKQFRLGTKVSVCRLRPTLEEWKHMTRGLYADGDTFLASNSTTSRFVRTGKSTIPCDFAWAFTSVWIGATLLRNPLIVLKPRSYLIMSNETYFKRSETSTGALLSKRSLGRAY